MSRNNFLKISLLIIGIFGLYCTVAHAGPVNGQFIKAGKTIYEYDQDEFKPYKLYASILNNGKVLLIGFVRSQDKKNIDSVLHAEIYDPTIRQFEPIQQPSQPLKEKSIDVVVLKDKRVLLVKGSGITEVYDPISNTFQKIGVLNLSRQSLKLKLLEDGQVLLMGNPSYDDLKRLVLQKAKRELEHKNPSDTIVEPIFLGKVPQVKLGDKLVKAQEKERLERINLFKLTPSEIFDLDTGTFTLVWNTQGTINAADTEASNDPVIPGKGRFLKATILQDGRVLLTDAWKPGVDPLGGLGKVPPVILNLAQVYDPATGLFQPTQDMQIARKGHLTVVLNDGTVLIVGGINKAGKFERQAELYIP